MVSKNKMWKAEKQEDLAFYAESDRIKLLLAVTLNKINVVLCCTNHIENLSTLKRQGKEEVLIQSFAEACQSNNLQIDVAGNNIGVLSTRMVEGISAQTMQEIIINFSISDFEKPILFYKTLEGLFTTLGNRLSVNASNTKVHKKRLRRAYKEQQRYKEEIRGLRNELYGLQMATKARIAAKRRLIRQQEQQIVEIRKQCREEVSKLCADSEQHLEQACATSQDHQEDLQRELFGAESTLDELVTTHQIEEANLRANKQIAEQALELVIAKYDETMFQLHAEVEGTHEGYLDELQQLRTLQAKFEEQETLYIAAMEEKRREELEELEKKILLFRRRMAAYKIQKFYRSYLVRKQASKGKKGKKGRKKQAANDKKK